MLRSCVRMVSTSGLVESVGEEAHRAQSLLSVIGASPFPTLDGSTETLRQTSAYSSTSRKSSSGPTRLGEPGSTDRPAPPARTELCLRWMRASDDARLELPPPPGVPPPAPRGGPVRRG